jgi:hypothetical protein
MKMTEEDKRFLSSLNKDGSPTDTAKTPLATRLQDKARIRAKRNKWAVFERQHWKWRLLEAGRQALKGCSE